MTVQAEQLAGHTLTEVDGVPVLHADVEGPLRAALVLGVGQAHEPLPLHGVSHVVEHLALSRRPEGPHAYNGATELAMTSFVVAGEPSEVVDHLASVCRSLVDLPFDRLEHERGVMRSEAAQRPTAAAADALLIWRWGATGYALPAFEEYALRWVGEEQVADWSTRFAADRAVLWLSGPPPDGLTLPLRPTSAPLPPPALAHHGVQLPGCFEYQGAGVVLSLLVPRAPEASPFVWLLHHRLQERLRHDLGLTYGPQSAGEVLDSDHRLLQVLVPCLPENGSAVTTAVAAVLVGLASEPATDGEWSLMQRQAALARAASAPDAETLSHLDNSARLMLLGGSPVTADEYVRLVEAVSPAEVAAFAGQVLPTLCLGVPDLAQVPAGLAAPLPVWSSDRVSGHRFSPREHPDAAVKALTVGTNGVTLLREGDQAVTVRFDRLAAALTFDDGACQLIADDALQVVVLPEQWNRGRAAVDAVAQHVPAHAHVPSGARQGVSATPPKDVLAVAVVVLLVSLFPIVGLIVAGAAVHGYRDDWRILPRYVQWMLGTSVGLGLVTTALFFAEAYGVG